MALCIGVPGQHRKRKHSLPSQIDDSYTGAPLSLARALAPNCCFVYLVRLPQNTSDWGRLIYVIIASFRKLNR